MARLAPILSALLTTAASGAFACAFHGYAPQDTMVDRMLASDHIVLAAADPDDPFRFKAVEAIEGPVADVQIPFLVDSSTRRRLASNAADRVLFARDGAYGPWQRLAYVDAEFAEVLDQIVAHLPAWEIGDDLQRFRLFAELAGHPDRVIRNLALLELDLADYGVLRRLDASITVEDTLRRMPVLAENHLRPIRVLLLGLTGDPAALPHLSAGLNRSLPGDTPLVGAYATALIELGGADAVATLLKHVLPQPGLSPESRERVVEAMAIHSVSGDAETRDAVRAGLGDAVAAAPELAGPVARQFGLRADWSLSGQVDATFRSGVLRSPPDLIAVVQYLEFAREAGEAVLQ